MNNLKMLREAKGLTQTELAEIAKVSQPTVLRIENGEQNATIKTVKSISDALEVPLWYLLSEDGSESLIQIVRAYEYASPDTQKMWNDLADRALERVDKPS